MLLRKLDQGGIVTVATFSPGGNYTITAGVNKTARIWSTRTGALLRTNTLLRSRIAALLLATLILALLILALLILPLLVLGLL